MAGSREVAGGFGWGDPGGAGVRGVDRQDFDGAGAEKFPLQSPGGHGIIICTGSARCALWGIRRTACRCDGMVDVTDSKSVGGDTVWVRVPPPAPAPPRATLPGAGFVFMMESPPAPFWGAGGLSWAPAHCAAEGIFWCRSMIGTRGYPASRSCFYFFPLAVPRLRTAILPAYPAPVSRARRQLPSVFPRGAQSAHWAIRANSASFRTLVATRVSSGWWR